MYAIVTIEINETNLSQARDNLQQIPEMLEGLPPAKRRLVAEKIGEINKLIEGFTGRAKLAPDAYSYVSTQPWGDETCSFMIEHLTQDYNQILAEEAGMSPGECDDPPDAWSRLTPDERRRFIAAASDECDTMDFKTQVWRAIERVRTQIKLEQGDLIRGG